MITPEGLETVYYDAETNTRFTDALINDIIDPAIDRAIQQDELCGDDSEFTGLDYEMSGDGQRISYDFFSQKDDRTTVITSTMYTVVNEVLEAGAALILDEIQKSDLDDDVKERYKDNGTNILDGKSIVEVFTRRTFRIETRDNRNSVLVEIELGYSVDGHVITQTIGSDSPAESFEFDVGRQAMFERNDLQEIIQALFCLDLINDSDMKRFIERDFKADFILDE
jgi:hypothetical protein